MIQGTHNELIMGRVRVNFEMAHCIYRWRRINRELKYKCGKIGFGGDKDLGKLGKVKISEIMYGYGSFLFFQLPRVRFGVI